MKISRNTDQQLILDWTPWLLGFGLLALMLVFMAIGLLVPLTGDDPMLWLFAFMFVVVGGGLWGMMIVIFVKRRQLILDRDTGQIVLRTRSVLKYTEETHDLVRLKAVALEHDLSDNGQTLSRPVLVLASRRKAGGERRVPIHSFYTNGSGPGHVADLINDWLTAQEAKQG